MSKPQSQQIIKQLVADERLPADFEDMARDYFEPLSRFIARRRYNGAQPLIVGINGAQGTGKSTLSRLLQALLQAQQLETVVLSLDDFYLTRERRRLLSVTVHPLLATRGVPGTHDLALGLQVVADLQQASATSHVAIPVFNKASDDRAGVQHWPVHRGAVDVILLEGWCVGARPAVLSGEPINTLEREHDADGRWRAFVAQQLQAYQQLFDQLDMLVMLKAPSMQCIVEWRTLQENRLRDRLSDACHHAAGNGTTESPPLRLMTDAELRHFIMHYERLTRMMLDTMPGQADVVFTLDSQHRINQAHYRQAHNSGA